MGSSGCKVKQSHVDVALAQTFGKGFQAFAVRCSSLAELLLSPRPISGSSATQATVLRTAGRCLSVPMAPSSLFDAHSRSRASKPLVFGKLCIRALGKMKRRA